MHTERDIVLLVSVRPSNAVRHTVSKRMDISSHHLTVALFSVEASFEFSESYRIRYRIPIGTPSAGDVKCTGVGNFFLQILPFIS